MKNFYIYTNEIKDPQGEIENRIRQYLTDRGAHVFDRPKDGAECILVLGGDGTLISASSQYAPENYVFFGINLGTVGYLADIELEDLERSLDAVIDDKFSVEDRMMLRGIVRRSNGEEEDFIALNDVVINRSGKLCIIDYSIFVNDKFLTLFRADGIIVSTPTGSTGYSLSAGGPIIEPISKLMMITPICAQSLSARSMIMSDDSSISIEINSSSKADNPNVEVCFDGRGNIEMLPGDKVIVRASSKTTRIGKLKEESFVEIMRQKLGN